MSKMVTNEEKAKEIAEKNAIIYDAEEDTANGLIYPTIHSTKECEKSALEMAEWKDEQFKRYLEKKKMEADKRMEDSYEDGEEWSYYIAEQNKQLFTEIINELFK